MSGGFTNYWEEAVMKHLFGILANTPPATVYIGVCTGGVAEDGTITGEPSGGGYARVAVSNNATGWDYSQVAGATQIANHAAIVFPEATGSWGTITTVFVGDNATPGAGNVLAFATLDVAKPIGSGDGLQFDAGDLAITLD